MKFIKENWFKIIIAVCFFLVMYSIFYYFIIYMPVSQENVNNSQVYQFNYGEKEDLNSVAEIEETLEEYGASVLHIGGWGSHAIEKSAYYLDTHGYLIPPENYVSTFFNTPADILTAQCADGFKLTSCESNSNNEVYIDEEMGWCRMIIEKKMQNRLNIKCLKNN